MTKLSVTLIGLAAGALLCGPAMAVQGQGPGKNTAALTADQKAKIKEIRKNAHQAVLAVLTDAQRKVLDDAKGKGKDARKSAHQEVRKTLTADQKAKIKEIRQTARKAIREIRGVKAGQRHQRRNAAAQPATT